MVFAKSWLIAALRQTAASSFFSLIERGFNARARIVTVEIVLVRCLWLAGYWEALQRTLGGLGLVRGVAGDDAL